MGAEATGAGATAAAERAAGCCPWTNSRKLTASGPVPTVLGFFVLALVVLGVTGALFPTVGWRGMLVGLLCLLIPLAVLLRLFRD